MITITASGFIARKPELVLVGAKRTPKCEFTVCDVRRDYQNGEWVDVWEYVTFVAWKEEAEKVASRLDKGHTITCTGLQETSVWTDQQQVKHKAVKYRLTAWDSKPPRKPDGGNGSGQAPNADQRPSQAASGGSGHEHDIPQ